MIFLETRKTSIRIFEVPVNLVGSCTNGDGLKDKQKLARLVVGVEVTQNENRLIIEKCFNEDIT